MPKKLLLLPPLSASSTLRAPRASPAARPAMNAARTGYRVFSANAPAACPELAKRIPAYGGGAGRRAVAGAGWGGRPDAPSQIGRAHV